MKILGRKQRRQRRFFELWRLKLVENRLGERQRVLTRRRIGRILKTMLSKAKDIQCLDQSAARHNKARLCKGVIGIVRRLRDQRASRALDGQPIRQLRHTLESFSISNALQPLTAYQHSKRVHFAEPLEHRREFQDAAEEMDVSDDSKTERELVEEDALDHLDASETPPRVRKNVQEGLARELRIEAEYDAGITERIASQSLHSPIDDIPSAPIVGQHKESAASYSSIFTMLSDLTPNIADFSKTLNWGGARFEDDAERKSQQLEEVLSKLETPKKTQAEVYGGLSAIYKV